MDVGDFEYWKIKAVLESIDSPTQLHLIETNSPQICGEDAELWQKFIARDIPKWEEKNYVPRNPLNWHKVYKKYKKEQQEKIKQDEEELKARMAGIQKERGKNVSKLVDIRLLPKIPKDPKMQYNAGVKIGKRGVKKDSPSSLVWSAGSKTKLTDGKSVLTRARREAKEIGQRSKLSMPTHQLVGRAGQVRKAPAGMVDEYKRAAQPPLKILAKRKSPVGTLSASGPSLEEREKRLRALTAQRKNLHALEETVVGSSDSEEEVDSMDELFAERPKAPPPSRKAPTPSSSRPHPSQDRGRQSQPAPSSSPPRSGDRGGDPKPSDLISSMISKPKPRPLPRSIGSSPVPSRGSSPAGFRRSPSPSHGDRKPPLIKRKRPEVDIFNRKVKRPRVG
jgi:elongin-A